MIIFRCLSAGNYIAVNERIGASYACFTGDERLVEVLDIVVGQGKGLESAEHPEAF